MDELLESLRAANPVPRSECMPIERIWERLDQAGVRTDTRGPGRARFAGRGRITEWIAVSVAVAVSLSIVAVVLLSAASRTRAKPTTRPAAAACGSSAIPAPVLQSDAHARSAGPPDPRILKDVAVLRNPPGANDKTAVACEAQRTAMGRPLPQDPTYVVRADPAYVRYAARGVFGGQVFVYALPGVARARAYKGMPANSALAEAETQPSVCLLTVGGPAGSPAGCTNLKALQSPRGAFDAAQIPGTSMSVMSGIVRDGITAVVVYDHGKVIQTAPVENNVVQFVVNHNAPADVYLRVVLLTANGRPLGTP
jgi:hypothetical protein